MSYIIEYRRSDISTWITSDVACNRFHERADAERVADRLQAKAASLEYRVVPLPPLEAQ